MFDPMILKIRRLHELALMPKYAHPNDSGLDLFSVEDVDIPSRETLIWSLIYHTTIGTALSNHREQIENQTMIDYWRFQGQKH